MFGKVAYSPAFTDWFDPTLQLPLNWILAALLLLTHLTNGLTLDFVRLSLHILFLSFLLAIAR
jgi:hypothetical protein